MRVISSSVLMGKENQTDWNSDYLYEITNKRFRRIDRFAYFILAGSLLCLKDKEIDDDINIYFGSAHGDINSTICALKDIHFHKRFAMPFTFINTLSNTPLFYLCEHLNLKSMAICVSHQYFSFEKALEIALLDIKTKTSKKVLVGCTDIVANDIKEMKKSIGLKENDRIFEVSSWLYLDATFNDIVIDVKYLHEREEFSFFNFDDYENIYLLNCKKDIIEAIKNKLNKNVVDFKLSSTNQSGACIVEAIKGLNNAIIINKDPRSGYAVTTFKKNCP